MRILYLDIDTLRPDHLGCYGYHRNTSPTVDAIAREGVRFSNVYVSDAPCLPSRSALFTGRFGIHTGVVDHGGIAADPFIEGPGRKFGPELGRTSWMRRLRDRGFRTVSISPFAERHGAWWFNAGFSEMINTGKRGQELAHEALPFALRWLEANAREDKWFLQVNVWDPHTPYRTPESYGNPFANDPPPDWLTEDIRREHWNAAGAESAQEPAEFQTVCRSGYPHPWEKHPRQPVQMSSINEVRRMFDGYDTGIRYADDHLAQVIAMLKEQGVYNDTAIIVSSDHGENLGELNIYGAHMTADEATNHIPLIIRWPGVTDTMAGQAFDALHLNADMAATVIELCGGKVPDNWDGASFAKALRDGRDEGRDYLVLSHMAGSCQRSVRFKDYLCIRSYHDGYHCLPDRLLFDVKSDSHETRDLATERPDLVGEAMMKLDEWHGDMMRTATHAQDPLWTVMLAGGAEHTRGCLPGYLKRLGETGREAWAEQMAKAHPKEL